MKWILNVWLVGVRLLPKFESLLHNLVTVCYIITLSIILLIKGITMVLHCVINLIKYINED